MFDIESIKLKINQESRTRNYFIPIKLEVFSFSNFFSVFPIWFKKFSAIFVPFSVKPLPYSKFVVRFTFIISVFEPTCPKTKIFIIFIIYHRPVLPRDRNLGTTKRDALSPYLDSLKEQKNPFLPPHFGLCIFIRCRSKRKWIYRRTMENQNPSPPLLSLSIQRKKNLDHSIRLGIPSPPRRPN